MCIDNLGDDQNLGERPEVEKSQVIIISKIFHESRN